MAAVIGDLVSDPSHFHAMISNSAIQHQHSHQSSHYHQPRPASNSISRRCDSASVPRYQKSSGWEPTTTHPAETTTHVSASAGASRFPSPPASADYDTPRPSQTHDRDGDSTCVDPNDRDDAPSRGSIPQPQQQQQQQQPSPASDGAAVLMRFEDKSYIDTATSPRLRGQTIRLRDLAHIQSLAKAELLTGTGTGILDEHSNTGVRYEISAMPIGDIIEMVAALLTKITTTNDLQHDAMQRNMAHQQQQQQQQQQEPGQGQGNSGGGSKFNGFTGFQLQHPVNASVLAFHGKNVPAITILSYLSRIHKYCPTTYDVFLSLLVYFDRMTEGVNRMVTAESRSSGRSPGHKPSAAQSEELLQEDTELNDYGFVTVNGSDLVDTDDESVPPPPPGSKQNQLGKKSQLAGPLTTYFVVDSFNIHRLIISGVTCASKFFSDVFYTNSRYAKVGGLPLAELNHLEIQFLVLNDFRLQVNVETLEQYGTMLVEFYAREVVAQRSRPVVGME